MTTAEAINERSALFTVSHSNIENGFPYNYVYYVCYVY